jgi:hypothetical protein
MWINLETKKVYNNRKEAKLDLGHATFNMLLKKNKVVYITEK